MPKNNLIPILLGTLFLLSCTGANSVYGQVVTLPDIDISASPNGIVPLPPNTPAVFREIFSKYNIKCLRPAIGLSADKYLSLLGKKSRVKLKKFQLLRKNFI